MGQAQIVHLANELLWLVLMLSLPVVLVTSVVGVLIGLVQALTQVQDQTVAYLCKMVATCVTLALSYHWLGEALLRYTERSFDLISHMG